jgi:hypothetical protein
MVICISPRVRNIKPPWCKPILNPGDNNEAEGMDMKERKVRQVEMNRKY